MMAHSKHSLALSLTDLLDGYVAAGTVVDIKVTGITSNSRSVTPGDVFIALGGLTRHAMDFAQDAVKLGAVAILYDADDDYSVQRVDLLSRQLDITCIAIAGLDRVCGEIASRFYHEPSKKLRLIGITGTDGKTSVTHLLVQAFNNLGLRAGSVGTLGYGVANRLKMTAYTTPDAIALQSILFELVEQDCEYVVMEVSSHALEQYRVNGCQFDFAVLTNLGSDHLDYHGNQELYAAAKAKLFAFDELKTRVVNSEDSLGRQLATRYKGDTVVTYSSNLGRIPQADIQLIASHRNDQGLGVTALAYGRRVDVQTRLIGKFNIDNILACMSVMIRLGLDHLTVEKCLQDLKPIPGRMDYFAKTRQHPAVVIDFAHTEQALEACLESVKGHYNGQLYCIFGCGGDRDQSKRPKMAAVAERLADHVIITEDNPRSESPEQIMQDILSGFQSPQKVRVIHDRQTAIETAIAQAEPDDLVVIAGKGHEQIQIIGDKRLPFSDHYVVQKMMGSRF